MIGTIENDMVKVVEFPDGHNLYAMVTSSGCVVYYSDRTSPPCVVWDTSLFGPMEMLAAVTSWLNEQGALKTKKRSRKRRPARNGGSK